MEIPQTMKGVMIHQHNEELKVTDLPVPSPGPGQALVRITSSGVCHTDVHVISGDWKDLPSILPLIPGHEGVGVVTATGSNVTNVKVGDRVGIAWLHESCGACEFCNTGRETHCQKQTNSGYTVHGCFSEYTLAAANFLAKIPDGLSSTDAAPILCAGVTTYTGIKNTGAQAGQFITVIGAAGGLGHLAVQYARAFGLRVIGVDVGQDKLDFACKLGAEFAVDGRDPDVVKKIHEHTEGGSHAVICLAASMPALKSALKIVRRNGTVVMIGLPNGELPVDIVDLILRGVTIKGSLVGTREDLKEALDFAARGLVHPQIEVCKMTDVKDIFERLHRGDVKGRIVVEL